MLAPNFTEMLITLGTLGIILAALIYLFLRLKVWGQNTEKTLEYVRKHALWTGVIAWGVSSLSGAGEMGIFSSGQLQLSNNPWDVISWSHILGPVLAVLVVHSVGQLSWPVPKSPTRVAVIEFRRTRDFVPNALGVTVVGIFAVSVGALVWLAFAPAFTPAEPLPSSGALMSGTKGRVPGYILATALGVGLLLLTAGTLLVMRLIASRRSLEDLTPEQNKTLRIIGINRLLRVCATVASGLAAVGGNYLAQPAPGSTTTSWVNWMGVLNVLVLFAMLLWKPPLLETDAAAGAYSTLFGLKRSGFGQKHGILLPHDDGPAASHLADSTLAAVIPAALLGALLGTVFITWLGWLGPLTVGIIFILLAYAALEGLLRRNYATPGNPRTTLRKPLPWPLFAALILGAAGLAFALSQIWLALIVGIGTGQGWTEATGPGSFLVVPLCCATAILLAGALAAWQVLRRTSLDRASALLDRTLRRRSLFRIARTVAAGWFTVIAAILLVFPFEGPANPLAPAPNFTILTALAIVMSALLLVYPVRNFTPKDFLPPPASTPHPPNTKLSK